jgi:hypothetical protein
MGIHMAGQFMARGEKEEYVACKQLQMSGGQYTKEKLVTTKYIARHSYFMPGRSQFGIEKHTNCTKRSDVSICTRKMLGYQAMVHLYYCSAATHRVKTESSRRQMARAIESTQGHYFGEEQ